MSRGGFLLMSVAGYRKAVMPILLAVMLAAPAAANAWTVTVHVHGAGGVDETTAGDLLNCTVAPSNTSNASVTDCVGGSPSGNYASGWIVDLAATEPTFGYDRGWRFEKWYDGTGSGQINCDPQDQTGDQTSPTDCKFQIFGNLYVDLYFHDIFANPVDSLTGSPAAGAKTNATTATFGFNASGDLDSNFQCKLDRPGSAGVWIGCGSPLDKSESYSNLVTNGSYTFSVRSVDPSGNVGGSMSRAWTVDTVAPTVGVTGGPAQGSTTNSSSAGFTLTPSETVSSLECKLDRPGVAGTYAACGSTTPSYSDLTADGSYTFSTRATDTAGNAGAATTRSWTVDRTPPNSSIGGGPSGPMNSTTATFPFSATGGAVSYECKLNPGTDWEPCSSGKSYSSLTPGTYVFSVRATDGAGNVEDTPATATFTVDTQAPDTSVDSGPSGTTSTNSASFMFSATEPNVSFECRLDAGPWESCTSGKTYSSLAAGSHTFYVRGTDQAGNLDASAASRTWTISAPAGGGGGGTPSGGTPSGGTPSGGTLDTPPTARLSAARQRLARVLSRGLVASARTSEAGRLRLDVLYKGKVVATSGSRAITRAGSKKLTARFTRKWKRALGHLRSAKLTLRLTATDKTGHRTVKKKTLKLKR
jgi:hypothetical protein